MKFVYPEFLFALSAISIPIIIHLFNFRKFKKIYFTNVRFLTEIQQETQSKSKLKHLLVLFSRILAILFLVLAFCQPYIPINDQKIDKSTKTISVFVDNSFSMEATGSNGTLLDEAKQRAKEIANSYDPSDQFQLLTGDFEGRHQRKISRDEFIELVDDIKISPASRRISEVVTRQKDLESNAKKSYAFILSDFQASISDIENIKPDSNLNLRFVPLKANQRNNLYIDSCWLTSPVKQLNQPLEMSIKISNKSENNVDNIPVKLSINGIQKALSSFSLDANVSATITLSFTISQPGSQQGLITISDYPVTFDDQFYFSFEVAKNLPVLVINGEKESPYLNALYGNDAYFVLKNNSESQLDYSSLGNNRIIILNEIKTISSGLASELKRYIETGGSVVIFPHPESELTGYNSLFESTGINTLKELNTTEGKIEKLNTGNILYKDIFEKNKSESTDLPLVKKHFSFNKKNKTSEEILLKLENGESFLSKYTFGKGNVYLFSSPLSGDFSNFGRHAIFVPSLFNIALFSEKTTYLSNTIGKDVTLELSQLISNGDNVYHLSKDKFDIIPEHRIIDSKMFLFLHGQITEAGQYTVMSGKNELESFAFNYDRKESDLSTTSSDVLRDKIEDYHLESTDVIETSTKDLSQTLNEINQGIRLWKLCVIFALIFLGIEILLLRFYKRTEKIKLT